MDTRQPADQRQSSFFGRLPTEISDLIYREAIADKPQPIEIIPLRVKESKALCGLEYLGTRPFRQFTYIGNECDLPYKQRQRNASIPYLNGLAQTCRLAYQESSHLLFQAHAFSFTWGVYLQGFIRDHRPIHLQSITELTVQDLSRPRPFSDDVDQGGGIQPRDLQLLKPFTGLRILSLDEASFDLTRLKDPRNYPRELIKGLARAGYVLESLQTIVVRSRIIDAQLNHYSQTAFDFDDIPGWVYSYSYSPTIDEERDWDNNFTETLQRVHGPPQPERDREQRIKAELANDIS